MTVTDWWVVGVYMTLMLTGAWHLGRTQSSRTDYYLGGNRLPGWTLATSVLATQCSTNSLLGAPAFVGFIAGGGMLWLQYELAVPLAMLLLCFAFIPLRRTGVISIYEFLEQRLGLGSRLLASGCFLFFRGVATGVTVYGVTSVISLLTGISFINAVLLLMGITITYDLLGGMRAVVISDVVQMVLLLSAILFGLVWLFEPLIQNYHALSSRTNTIVYDWGLSTGNNYGFWPMVFGGLFLYMAYYGCDQSQAQRLLSASDETQTQKVLVLNGLLRFPLVLTYCLVGLGLAAYAIEHPDFIPGLPLTANGSPNYNLVFPAFVEREFAPGLAGLVMVGIFAAAMSSIDSTLNSLSASTVEDFISRFRKYSEKELFIISKIATFFWGTFAVLFSFQVEHVAPTVLEGINKIGSMANGPLLGLFAIAVFFPAVGQRAAITGFCIGLISNLLIWFFFPMVSWLWWNVSGFIINTATAFIFAIVSSQRILLTANAIQVPRSLIVRLGTMTVIIFVINWIISIF
jgi:SSS family solute:Na+ symporter|tara:strand:+ start:182 stop:1732 length:1551 start_codon:yes stop_codon:yes gene_type:complete